MNFAASPNPPLLFFFVIYEDTGSLNALTASFLSCVILRKTSVKSWMNCWFGVSGDELSWFVYFLNLFPLFWLPVLATALAQHSAGSAAMHWLFSTITRHSFSPVVSSRGGPTPFPMSVSTWIDGNGKYSTEEGRMMCI